MDDHALDNALVELTAPDGRVLRFRFGAVVPYAGVDYVVLLELENAPDGQEQILVTRLETEPDGQTAFVVAQEEDVICAVYEKYVAASLRRKLQEEP